MSQPDESVHRPVPRLQLPDWNPQTSYIDDYRIRLPDSLFERLHIWAEANQTTRETLIHQILDEAVRDHNFESPAPGPTDPDPT